MKKINLTCCSVFGNSEKIHFFIRYMKGEMKNEEEISFLQQVVGHGIDRDELRDEIYVICMLYRNNFFFVPTF